MHAWCVVPAVVCDMANATGGGISIAWRYDHTGGLPLTIVSIRYIFREGSTESVRNGPPVEPDDTTAVIRPLKAGLVYTAMVIAANQQGFRMVQCPSVQLDVGEEKSGLAILIISACLCVQAFHKPQRNQ